VRFYYDGFPYVVAPIPGPPNEHNAINAAAAKKQLG
jgi:hypothetical protein